MNWFGFERLGYGIYLLVEEFYVVFVCFFVVFFMVVVISNFWVFL